MQLHPGRRGHAADEGRIELASRNAFETSAGGSSDQLGDHRRGHRLQLLEHAAEPVAEPGAAADPQGGDRSRRRGLNRPRPRLLHRGQYCSGLREEPRTRRRQPDSPRRPVEQADSQLALEPGQLLAHRRLPDRQGLRSAAEVQVLRDCDEVLELTQLHLPSLPRT